MVEDPNIYFDYSDIPTLEAFSDDDTQQRVILGPFGSAKSSGCCIEVYRRAMMQKPGRDGVRRTRWAVVRNTNRMLDDTTIVTWMRWMRPFGDWAKTPRNFTINNLRAPDGSPVEAEVLFRPLDKPDDVDNLLSLELTGAWFNELREIPKLIWDTTFGRCGRYPPMDEGGPTWWGQFGDTNPPDTDHWAYYLFEEDKPRRCPVCTEPDLGWTLFVRDNAKDYSRPQFCPRCGRQEHEGIPVTAIYKQPSGRSADAENLTHLVKGYYSNLAIGKDPGWITVYIDGKYGYVRDGRPVYTNYTDVFHLSPTDVEPHRSYPLIIGYDCTGFNQAATINQWHPNGRFNTYDELYAEDCDARTFLTQVLKPYLWGHYLGMRTKMIGDPAGKKRNDTDSRSAFKEAKTAGFDIEAAFSNSWDARFGAVNRLLLTRTEGRGTYQVNPRCKLLVKGFRGAYRMERLQVTGQERFKDQPVKTKESHVADSLQYACMGTERVEGVQKTSVRERAEQPTMGAFT